MFKITATFEDFQMQLESRDGRVYEGSIADGHSGDSYKVSLTAKQVEHIVAFNMDADGEPQATTLEERYEDMEKWIVENNLPVHLRPMP